MSWEFFDYDPLTKTTEYFVPSVDGKEFVIVSERDDGDLLEDNYQQLMHARPRERWGEGRIFARLPPAVMVDLMQRGILGPDFDANTVAMRNWLNSSENIYRVRWGRV